MNDIKIEIGIRHVIEAEKYGKEMKEKVKEYRNLAIQKNIIFPFIHLQDNASLHYQMIRISYKGLVLKEVISNKLLQSMVEFMEDFIYNYHKYRLLTIL
jgi:flagellar biosynthesis component FlhA